MDHNTMPVEIFDWDKSTNSLSITSEYWNGSFPKSVEVFSKRTGKGVIFNPVGPDSRFYDEDGWDGEQMVYVPNVKASIEKLTVYHAW